MYDSYRLTHSKRILNHEGYLFALGARYNATMDGGCFRPAQNYGYVRATTMMNSKSSNDFRWSVRLTSGGKWIGLGIASNELVQNELSGESREIQSPFWITDYDQNAISFHPFSGSVWRGTTHIQQVNPYLKSGDEIHFRFQPKMKKFFISFVSQLFRHFSFVYKPGISERKGTGC